jgi:chromosome segregation ATPase
MDPINPPIFDDESPALQQRLQSLEMELASTKFQLKATKNANLESKMSVEKYKAEQWELSQSLNRLREEYAESQKAWKSEKMELEVRFCWIWMAFRVIRNSAVEP